MKTEPLSEAIRLAVAPVFLLSSLAGLLGVFSGRLARIVDRFLMIEATIQATGSGQPALEPLLAEIRCLQSRMITINLAIKTTLLSALMVALLVVSLFVGTVSIIDLSLLIAVLFSMAMVFLIIALACYQRETTLSSRTLRRWVARALSEAHTPTPKG